MSSLFARTAILLAIIRLAHTATHHLIVGTFGSKSLYTLEFNDQTLSLAIVSNTSTTVASSWIALSHNRKNLYGTAFQSSDPAFVGYSLENSTTIQLDAVVPAGGNCTGSAIFVTAASVEPYNVYGSFFGSSAGCGAVLSVDDSGALHESIQNFTYTSKSGVHGLSLAPDSSFLYSADDTGNAIWTHSMNQTSGLVSLVDSIDGPSTGSDPRHVTVHPNGRYLFTVLEGANAVAQYRLNETTGIPTYTNVSYSLIPADGQSSSYWSDEIALSFSNSLLWATSRARSTNETGYISAFKLDAYGAIAEQMFLTATTSSGGSANSVSPSGFSDHYVALTDSSVGFVEIWQLSKDYTSASVVAHLDIDDGGCCANAVWYS